MLRNLITDFRQAFFSKKFLFVISLITIIILLSSYQQIASVIERQTKIGADFKLNLLLSSITNDTMLFLLPIFSSLPYTTSFIDDINSAYIKLYLSRTSRQKYLFSKLVSCLMSGGLCYVIAILISYFIMSLTLMPMEALLAEKSITDALQADLYGVILLYFASGAFWSLLGLTMATIAKHMAYASPFIVYYLLIILHERYFNDLYVIYPKEWIRPSDNWAIGNIGVLLFLFEMIILVSIIFILLAKRRLARL